MKDIKAKYIHRSWGRTNIINLISGLAVGLLISIFISVLQGKLVTLRYLISYTLFSMLISLCVVNSIFAAQKIFRLKADKVSFIIIFYVASLLGMAIGTELSFFILSLIRDTPYHFFHGPDMLFSALVVIVVCTINFVQHSQKAYLTNQIREKEFAMMQLKQLKTQAELASLHARINPHFLYNALNSIASLIHHDQDKAELMTLKLSKLFRYSINYNKEDMVSIAEEIEIVMTYLEIEKVRFGDRIRFTIDVDEGLRTDSIPRFLLQPLIENALKHGLATLAEGGELSLRIRRIEQSIEISLADNGVPFPDDINTGYGLQSTYEKLDLLYPDNYELSISNHPFKQVKIVIPLYHE